MKHIVCIFKTTIKRFLSLFNVYRVSHHSYISFELVKSRFCPEDKCFFLKINNLNAASLRCIQTWLDVVDSLNRKYVFICDNIKLKKTLLSKMTFPDNKKISFVKSKRKKLMKYAKKLTFNSSNWQKMTVAHMMPFYMVCNNVKFCWHIDADDTFFVLETEDIKKVVINVEKELMGNDYNAISLDMWASRHEDKHWTFGVACIKNNINYPYYFENPDYNWKNHSIIPNFDGYFTYLRDIKTISVISFYVENTYFVHCGDYFMYPIKWPLSFWEKGFVHFPMIEKVFGLKKVGKIKVSHLSAKIDIGITATKAKDLLLKLLPIEDLGGY